MSDPLLSYAKYSTLIQLECDKENDCSNLKLESVACFKIPKVHSMVVLKEECLKLKSSLALAGELL